MDGLATIFNAPTFSGGTYRIRTNNMLEYGKDIRDNLLWQYPILPGAIMTYQQIASSREIKVSASNARQAARAVDWINSAVCYNLDGSVEYGFQAMLKRRVLDYLCVGRTMWFVGDELTYIDPVFMRFMFDPPTPYWLHQYTHVKYAPSDLIINHPYPIGGGGYFMCPLVPIIPKAMMAWLLDEHDRASADGRKIRDIIIAGSEELAHTLQEAIKQSLALWAGGDVEKNGVPLAYLEQLPPSGTVQDMIGKLGLAEIPEAFNRADFEFTYVNEIAAVLGIALRHFWNAEKATNRALEDVQEARQLQKGPSEFVRTEQRLLNSHPNALKRFGSKTRMGFIEETDTQTQNTRATVLKAYSEALEKFALVFNGQVNGDAFLAWLQSEDILPADLKLVTDMGTMISPDRLPVNENNPQQKTDAEVSPLDSGKSMDSDDLEEGEVTLDLNYKVIDRRRKMISGFTLIQDEIMKDVESLDEITEEQKNMSALNFGSILEMAQRENYERFKSKASDIIVSDIPVIDGVSLTTLMDTKFDDLTSEQHLAIGKFINEY